MSHLVDAAVQTFRRVDVMIGNAGIMPRLPLEVSRSGTKSTSMKSCSGCPPGEAGHDVRIGILGYPEN
jgi:NAD(P)-dependent dehydrogenase (short-subunit alcohol dehydrogenase family)